MLCLQIRLQKILLTGADCSMELCKREGQKQILGFLSQREQRSGASPPMHREGQSPKFHFLLFNYHMPPMEEGLRHM